MTLRGARFARQPANRLFISPLGHNNRSLLALNVARARARLSRKHQAERRRLDERRETKGFPRFSERRAEKKAKKWVQKLSARDFSFFHPVSPFSPFPRRSRGDDGDAL